MAKKQYLLVQRNPYDDYPLYLTDDREKARQIAAGESDELDAELKELLGEDDFDDHNLEIYVFENGRIVDEE